MNFVSFTMAVASSVVVMSACGPHATTREVPTIAHSVQEIRPTDTSTAQMWRYNATDTVLHFDDGGFRVHYTKSGTNAVPAADSNSNTVPDFVETAAQIYGEVGETYATAWGFRRPPSDATLVSNGGDGTYDVYLLDFALSADGAMRVDDCLPGGSEICRSYVVQENDFTGYGYPSTAIATRILASHEYFHAVQAAYDHGQDSVVTEGTAVWATEHFDPSTNDFENFIDGYLERTDRPIDSPPPGPVPSFAYGSAIFFEFLSEKYGDAIIKTLWEHLENGKGFASEPGNAADPTWVIQLDAALKANHQSSFAQAFLEFCRWNLYLGTAADPTKAYAHGSTYPRLTTTSQTLPFQQASTRIFYASAQYFTLNVNGRAAVQVTLVDDPATTIDETKDLAVVAVAESSANKVISEQVSGIGSSPSVTLSTTGAARVIVGLVNTMRATEGTVQSRRADTCIGTVDEVNECLVTLGNTVDAGLPDAGPSMNEVDAGSTVVDAGVTEPEPTKGCSCTAFDPRMFALAVGLFLLFRRRKS